MTWSPCITFLCKNDDDDDFSEYDYSEQCFACFPLEPVFLNVTLWKQREYMITHPNFCRELSFVLKLPRIIYFLFQYAI